MVGVFHSFSLRRWNKNIPAIVGLAYILFLLWLSVFAPRVSTDDTLHANRQNLALRFKPPGHIDSVHTNVYSELQHPDPFEKVLSASSSNKRQYYLGTDGLGRDVLSRLILGTRVSLLVGFMAVLVSLLIGVVAGSLAGYYGKWIDRSIVWLMQLFWSIPTILLAMVLLMSIPHKSEQQLWLVFLAVGLTMWVDTARLIRGLFLQLKERQFVEAATVLGYSDLRIIFHHIFPNTIPALIVITTSNFASAILMESGLSYLGLGVQPPAPSWGSMLREYYSYLGTNVSYLAIFPGIAITLAVLAFYTFGNGLRDAWDVKN